MTKVYHYPKCSTCKKALAWFDARHIELKKMNIVDNPPSLTELKRAHKLSGLPVHKLFNTSGASYREGGFKEKLKNMSELEALEALATDGKLIKRPLVLGKDFALVGFKEAEYQAQFS